MTADNVTCVVVRLTLTSHPTSGCLSVICRLSCYVSLYSISYCRRCVTSMRILLGLLFILSGLFAYKWKTVVSMFSSSSSSSSIDDDDGSSIIPPVLGYTQMYTTMQTRSFPSAKIVLRKDVSTLRHGLYNKIGIIDSPTTPRTKMERNKIEKQRTGNGNSSSRASPRVEDRQGDKNGAINDGANSKKNIKINGSQTPPPSSRSGR
jgi:hypothetical protein